MRFSFTGFKYGFKKGKVFCKKQLLYWLFYNLKYIASKKNNYKLLKYRL